MFPGLSCPEQLCDTHPSRGLQDRRQGPRCSVCSPTAGFGLWTRQAWQGKGELQAQQRWALTAGYSQAPSAPRACTEPHTEEMKLQPTISPRPYAAAQHFCFPPSSFLSAVQRVGAEPPPPCPQPRGSWARPGPVTRHTALGPLPGQAEAPLSLPHCRNPQPSLFPRAQLEPTRSCRAASPGRR